MNVKPGDLAKIVFPTMNGWLVEVLEAMPIGEHEAGCGHGHKIMVRRPFVWRIRSLQGPMRISRLDRKFDFCIIGGCEDRWLRPILPPDEIINVLGAEVLTQ